MRFFDFAYAQLPTPLVLLQSISVSSFPILEQPWFGWIKSI